MIKSLKRNDIRSTPFVANKSWNSQNQTFDNTISWQSGSQSGSLFLSFVDYKDGTQLSLHSSSIAYQQQDPDFLRFRIGQEITGTTFYPTSSKYYDSSVNPTNIDGTYQGLVYNTLKNLFYKETANPTQIFGLESLNPVDVNRTLTKQINVFNVPQNKFGEKIVPNSIEIKQQLDDGHFVVIDDGNTNLKLSGSHFVDVQNAMYNCVSAIVNITDTSYTYDGSPKSASVTTNPSDLITITTYNGSETPPTNAGTYTILSTIWDGYYCGSTGSTFIINKAVVPPPTITVTNVVATYDGNPHYTTATTTPSGLSYTIVYTLNGETILDNKPIDVGVYTATATVDDGNYTVTGIGTVTINPPTLTVNFAAIADRVYGTTTIALIASSSPFSYPIKYSITSGDTLAKIDDARNPTISLSPTLTATSLGSVTVKAETIVPPGYTSAYATRTFTVTPKPITLDVKQITVTYPGSSGNLSVSIVNTKLNNWLVFQDPSQLVTRTDKVTISGPNAGTIPSANPGTPVVTLGSPLYTLGETHALKYSLIQPTLTAVVPAVSTITLNDSSFTYDGSPYTIKDIINEGYATLTSGTYIIKFFTKKEGQLCLFIDNTNQGEYPDPKNTICEQTYYTSGQVNTNIGPFSVGEYSVTITNENSNPKEIKEAKLTINRAPATIELDNLTQGGVKTTGYDPVYTFSSASFKVNWSGQESKIRNTGPNYSTLIPTTFAENITDPILKSVKIKDRNFKDIDLLAVDKTLYTPTITYVGGDPTVIGESFVQASFSPSVKNVYGDTQAKLKISDFYYITTASLQVQEYGYNGYTTQSLSVGKYYDRTTLSNEIRYVIKKSGHNLKLDYTLVGGTGGGSGEVDLTQIPLVQVQIRDVFPENLNRAYGGGGSSYIHLSWSFAPLMNGTAFADTDTNSPVYYNESIRLVAGRRGWGAITGQRTTTGTDPEIYTRNSDGTGDMWKGSAGSGGDSYIGIHYTGNQVVAWGYNYQHQCDVPDNAKSGVTAIAAGKFHTVALKSDGTVVAWGHNEFGQVTGIPSGFYDDTATANPVTLGGQVLRDVKAIAAGWQNTMALKNDGTVVVWGYNEQGQRTVPALPKGVTYTAIAAGSLYTVALKSDSTVVTWGWNVNRQTTPPDGLTGVTAIAAGWQHTMALKIGGTVVAWGNNENRQTIVPAGLTGVTAIAGGQRHTVALNSDGTVVAWGNNQYGQVTGIPSGGELDAATANPVTLDGQVLRDVTAIAAGAYHTVALKNDGTVVAWGNNDEDQTTVPAGLTGVAAIAAGFYHTVALKGKKWLDITAGGSGGARGYYIYRTQEVHGHITNINYYGQPSEPGFPGSGGKSYFNNSEVDQKSKIDSLRLQYYDIAKGNDGSEINKVNQFAPAGGFSSADGVGGGNYRLSLEGYKIYDYTIYYGVNIRGGGTCPKAGGSRGGHPAYLYKTYEGYSQYTGGDGAVNDAMFDSLGEDGQHGSVVIKILGIHRIYKNTFSNVIYDSHPESEYQ